MSAEVFIDWGVAARSAKQLVNPGPRVSLDEARAAVRELEDAAARADAYVSEVTGIAHPVYDAPTVVVDRASWIDLNAESLDGLMAPLVRKLTAKAKTSGVGRAIGSRVTGAEAGVLLSFMASRVLGQYDVFGREGGRLLLVAPNVIDAEQKMDVDPRDFRLWVCIHEVTHRLQFTANPWLEGYMRGLIEEFVEVSNLDPDSVRDQLKELASNIKARRLSDDDDDAPRGLLALAGSPEQRDVLDRMTAAMSLLEGHAEYVMDEVGSDVIPTVASIRRKFTARRKGRSPLDRFFRKLLGLEAKMKQYAEGRHFVDGVVREVGMAGFNRVWTSPETLPTRAELGDPAAWISRVRPHGRIDAATDVTDENGNTTRHFTVPRNRDHVPMGEQTTGEAEIIVERRIEDR
ncbi:zinc-dependent metalloprotease [Blastococcus sp. Marseille-P5729]|uniref:zinc-dependent metalloprotease n=1 Tax=Blastococcus sp. Marseille-P5729 TaxID=2086582 RepID=UPI000D10DA68|nr:zinc-dependent metalloprotease [Blastococcus sp. Marseille-P5729]